jgi:hypothetical protein
VITFLILLISVAALVVNGWIIVIWWIDLRSLRIHKKDLSYFLSYKQEPKRYAEPFETASLTNIPIFAFASLPRDQLEKFYDYFYDIMTEMKSSRRS